jgi:hypothetical protein
VICHITALNIGRLGLLRRSRRAASIQFPMTEATRELYRNPSDKGI